MDWRGIRSNAFDLEEINSQLRKMGHGRGEEIRSGWFWHVDELTARILENATPWPQTVSEEDRRVAEELPLRRDMISLLVYFRDNKVTGTPSTGNLPLKAVREVCASFVNPPPLETSIGETIYPVRSEIEVGPLFFLHILVSVGGMATGGMGKPWKLTPLGEHFLTEAAPKQVWYLLAVWWTQVNWAVSFSYGIPGGQMPPGFNSIVLKHLLALPTDE